jgi:arsenite transporter
VGDDPERTVVPALVALLTLTFAGVRPTALGASIGPHHRTAIASLVLNFLWAPLVALVLGTVLLGGQPDLRIGLVMLLVTPCTDWYLVFTRSARGNVPLAAALLPVYVTVLSGADADIPIAHLVRSVVVMLGIPVVLVVVARVVAHRLGASERLDTVVRRLQPAGLGLLGIAIVGIFAANADTVTDETAAFLRLLAPLALFFVTTYALATVVARRLAIDHPERVALTMSTLARNSPVALAVAASAFPDRPLVVVALVVGPLVELPVLALVASRLGVGERRQGRGAPHTS